jgi:WD40 repeat protein
LTSLARPSLRLPLAWSADGERLATFAETAIVCWSRDGRHQRVFPAFRNFSSSRVIRFLAGHRLLLSSPVGEADSPEERARIEDIALSVVDVETGRVVRNVPGPRPGGGPSCNEVVNLTVSPDERLVAMICSSTARQVDIFSIGDWNRLATLNLGAGPEVGARGSGGLAFSPDGKMLAVAHGDGGRIRFFETSTWLPSGSLVAYPPRELPPTGFSLRAIAFSPEGRMVAVGSGGGGAGWIHPADAFGRRVLAQGLPADPLRVYRLSDGRLVASLEGFRGGVSCCGLSWSPDGRYLAFQNVRGDIHFWNPFKPKAATVVARDTAPLGDFLFSRDGAQLAANCRDGVKVFDVVAG